MTYEITSYGRAGRVNLKSSSGGYPDIAVGWFSATNLLRADQTIAYIEIVDESTGQVVETVTR